MMASVHNAVRSSVVLAAFLTVRPPPPCSWAGVTVDMEERFCELVKDMGCTCVTIR